MGQCQSVRFGEPTEAEQLAAAEEQEPLPKFTMVGRDAFASRQPDSEDFEGAWPDETGSRPRFDTMLTNKGGQLPRELTKPGDFVVYASHEMNIPSTELYTGPAAGDNACARRALQLARGGAARIRVAEGLSREVSEVWRGWKVVDDPTPPKQRFAVAGACVVVRVRTKKDA